MAKYAISNLIAGSQQNLGAAYKSIVITTAITATLKRIRWYDIEVGQDGSPADNVIYWTVQRQTAAGTGSAATPNAIDPADGAAVTVGTVNSTGEGTVTANSDVWDFALNQRASYRWQVNPGSDQELVGPATNLAGLTLRAKAPSYASTVVGQVYFSE